MTHAPDDQVPAIVSLHRALDEQDRALTGPTVPEVVSARVRRVVGTAHDVLGRAEEENLRARRVVSGTTAFLAEAVGGFLRLPVQLALSRPAAGETSITLQLVDDLDHLGLTLDRVYDAVHRDDHEALDELLHHLAQAFSARTDSNDLTNIPDSALEPEVVRDHGLEVGDDGIPRLPVPDHPAPPRDPAEGPVR
ncbi:MULTISPECIES: hypothetical protein [unclassified Ornithinimicrobium]|uniref:hypothetical protein n=1 Tax=unclassified Ornithinimicrobium TaxID=2615080 RepID=UPI0038544FD6